MDIRFSKSAGSDDFHQEIIDEMNKIYQDFSSLVVEVGQNGSELSFKRSIKHGSFTVNISVIDLKNELIFIDFVGIG